MPTGYTAPIEEDPDYQFEQYVWRCARAFGALVLMRDDPMGASVPERFEPSPFYRDKLKEATARLSELLGTTLEQAAVLSAAEHESECAWRRKERERTMERIARYSAMRESVKAWQPPSKDHVELKLFMLQQLSVGAKFLNPDSEYLRDPEQQTPEAWLADAIAGARRNVERYAEEAAKEDARTEERNNWVRLLRESVPQPEKV